MNKKFKKILVALLSALMVFTYMPTMAFAAEGDVASVKTDNSGDTVLEYATFDAAFNATNVSANKDTHAVITLLADAAVETNATAAIPMTIKLNGHKLEEKIASISPAAEPQGSETVAYCRKDSDTEIVFAKHDPKTVYTWKEDSKGDWDVTGKEVQCEHCGVKKYTVTGTTTKTLSEDKTKITYTWTSTDGKETAKKVVDAAPEAAYSTAKASVVKVNNVYIHENGLPKIEATVYDKALGKDVEADAAVTAATDAELQKLQKDADAKVYTEDGETPTTGDNAKKNEAPTCSKPGAVIYKVVVSKNGTEVGTIYIKDSTAVEKTSHVKGAFKGYKLLKKTAVSGAKSESDARKAGEDAKVKVIKTSAETVGETTTYYYWSYGDLVTVSGTKQGNTNPTVTLTDADLDENGSFTLLPVYFCNYENENEVEDTAVAVAPYPNATTKAQASDKVHSTCEKWAYAAKAFTYTFNKSGQTTQSTLSCTLNFADAKKTEAAYSHVSDGTYNVVEGKDSTCETEGEALITCAICGKQNVKVAVEKKADTFGAYTGTGTPAIGAFKDSKGKTLTSSAHKVTLNTAKTEATVTATCEEAGGTYKWCTGANNNNHGHWVLQNETPAKGHNLVVVTSATWGTTDYAAENEDYTCTADVICSNAECDDASGVFHVKYHSKAGTDGINEKFSAIEIKKEEKGKDCKTVAKTTYTVKDVKDRTGAAITKTENGPASTKGDHAYVVKSFNWSADYESATATCECSFCKATGLSQTAKVTKATDATGLTTYTATVADQTDTKKVYTLEGAKVTYDTSKITDGNLVVGGTGFAPQTPEVTVTLNGTVIDSKELKETWSYDTAKKEVKLTVTWAADKAYDDTAEKKNNSASAKPFSVAAKSTFTAPTVTVKKGKETQTTETYAGTYDPAVAWSVEAKSTVTGAAVKYAISKELVEKQADIDALDYSLDKVDDIKDAGKYYVYAQQSKDGFTTYSALAATITIAKKSVTAYIDNFTMKQGETPDFKMTIVDYRTDAPMDVDKTQFKVTSVGGQALEDLIPGDYALLVSSDNYEVYTDRMDGRYGTVTVLTKDGKTAEEDAKATAEAADEALAAANKINTKNYTAASVTAINEAKAKLQEALKSGSTEDVKAATAALNDAIKNAVAKKANTMTVKAKTVKAKASKKTTIKKAKAFTVKSAKGKVTFKKTSGNKKITVSKAGKVVVKKGLKKGKTFKIKVKVTAAGNASYKKGVKTVTLKVKIK